jgi:hypothetical protein
MDTPLIVAGARLLRLDGIAIGSGFRIPSKYSVKVGYLLFGDKHCGEITINMLTVIVGR